MKPLALLAAMFGATALQAGFDLANSLSVRSCAFLHPQDGPYVETYLNIHGSGIRYEEVSTRRFRGEVAVTLILREGDEVFDFRKYRLESPTVSDTAQIDFALMDLQRMAAPEGRLRGEWTVEVTVEDLVDSTNRHTTAETLRADFAGAPTFSGIEFVESYRRRAVESPYLKNGMEIVPYALDFFPGDRSSLAFYIELYGTDRILESDQFLFTASIRERGAAEVNPNFWMYAKLETAPVVPVLREFDLVQLPSGQFDLVLEIRDTRNEVVAATRAPVYRINSRAVSSLENIRMMDVDSTWVDRYAHEDIDAYIRFVKTIAEPTEQHIITSIEDLTDYGVKKRFLYNFWVKRDTVSIYLDRGRAFDRDRVYPAEFMAWLGFLALVKEANDKYGTTSRLGYRTDRGRVMLQYGHPNDMVTRVNEPGASPYEIWHYNKLPDGQTNIRFIFYEPTLVSNDYKLIHSDAVGELQNPRWKIVVYQNVTDPGRLNDYDATSPVGSYGNDAGILGGDLGGRSLDPDQP